MPGTATRSAGHGRWSAREAVAYTQPEAPKHRALCVVTSCVSAARYPRSGRLPRSRNTPASTPPHPSGYQPRTRRVPCPACLISVRHPTFYSAETKPYIGRMYFRTASFSFSASVSVTGRMSPLPKRCCAYQTARSPSTLRHWLTPLLMESSSPLSSTDHGSTARSASRWLCRALPVGSFGLPTASRAASPPGRARAPAWRRPRRRACSLWARCCRRRREWAVRRLWRRAR